MANYKVIDLIKIHRKLIQKKVHTKQRLRSKESIGKSKRKVSITARQTGGKTNCRIEGQW